MTADRRLIDFHCHLSRAGGLAVLDGPTQGSLAIAETAPRVVAVTNTPGEWRTLSRADRDDRVLWSVGLHPGERHTNTAIADFHRAVAEAEAVGEIGLDFRATARTPRPEQINRLKQTLDSVAPTSKLVSLHSTSATGDLIDLLADRTPPGAILHWFLGTPAVIDRAIDLDIYFSVNEVMLRSGRGRSAVAEMPPNRVLLETDAPFGVNSKATPTDVSSSLESTVVGLARLWQLPSPDARAQVLANQEALLRRTSITRWLLRHS